MLIFNADFYNLVGIYRQGNVFLHLIVNLTMDSSTFPCILGKDFFTAPPILVVKFYIKGGGGIVV